MRKMAIVLFAVSALFAFAQPLRSQEQPGALSQRILTDVRLRGDSLVIILDELAQFHKLPIGVDEGDSDGCTLRKKVDVSYSTITVRSLMDNIIEMSNGCQWEISEDVVNVFPNSGPSSIALTVISDFSIRRGQTRENIRKSIITANEISSLMTRQKRRLTFSPAGLNEYLPIDKEFALLKSDRSVRSILNSIASRTYFWGLFGSKSPNEPVYIRF